MDFKDREGHDVQKISVNGYLAQKQFNASYND